MRAHFFPGQIEAIQQRVDQIKQEMRAEGRQRATRRMFLGLAVGGVVGACAGGGVMRALATAPPAEKQDPAASPGSVPVDPSLQWMRELATGPLDKLLAAQGRYIHDVGQRMPDDEIIWFGVARIANAVGEKDPRVQKPLRTYLIALSERPGFPASMRRWIEWAAAAGQ